MIPMSFVPDMKEKLTSFAEFYASLGKIIGMDNVKRLIFKFQFLSFLNIILPDVLCVLFYDNI